MVCVRPAGAFVFSREDQTPITEADHNPVRAGSRCRRFVPRNSTPTSQRRLVSPRMRLPHSRPQPAKWCMGSCHHGRAARSTADRRRHNRDRAPSPFIDYLKSLVVCVRPAGAFVFSREDQTPIAEVQHNPGPRGLLHATPLGAAEHHPREPAAVDPRRHPGMKPAQTPRAR